MSSHIVTLACAARTGVQGEGLHRGALLLEAARQLLHKQQVGLQGAAGRHRRGRACCEGVSSPCGWVKAKVCSSLCWSPY